MLIKFSFYAYKNKSDAYEILDYSNAFLKQYKFNKMLRCFSWMKDDKTLCIKQFFSRIFQKAQRPFDNYQ
jgi:hypothetical protein